MSPRKETPDIIEVAEHDMPAPMPVAPSEPVKLELSPPKSEPVATVPSIPSTALAHAGPIKAETRGAGEGGVLNESEAAIYRAKLVEQRRLAKERKEEEQK